MKAMLKQHLKAACSLSGVASFAAVAGLMATFVQPAAAASCQAINASGIPSTIPSGGCSVLAVGDTFEIDFSNLFASNPGDFAVNNDYSLQIANIGTGTLSFTNVELLVTGTIQPGPPANTGTIFPFDGPVSIWQQTSNPGFAPQTGQGITDFSVNGTGTNFGVGTAYKSANFKLSSPNTPAFGLPATLTAGLINTIPLDLSSVGVQTFTSAKIRGTLASSTASTPLFSAGLGIYTSNNPANQPPNLIYGNAFVSTPGPLPLLGAGAAFGMSRRLRRRIGASKVAA
jgi:hypothetical protein